MITNSYRWLLLLSISCPQILAQSAQISGKVADPSGKMVAKAEVTAINTETGLRRKTASNEAGYYLMPAMQPGEYEVTVQAEGFRQSSRKGVRLITNEQQRVDFEMQLGALSQEVTVSETIGERVDVDTGTLGRLVDGEQARGIALNGRNLVELMMLMPGVATLTDDFSTGTNTYNGSLGNFIVNGQRYASTNVTLDGGSNTDNGAPSSQTNPVNVDFVREMKMSSAAPSAQYGGNGGAQVNFTTRSGTAQFHGTVLEFFRNDKLNARSFFAPTTKDKLRLNNFGWNLGGPIIVPRLSTASQKRLFFFVGQEYKRRIDGTTFRLTLPTRAERSGIANVSTATALRYPSNYPVQALRGTLISDPSRGTASNPNGVNIMPRQNMTANGQAIMKIYDKLESMASLYADLPSANNATFQTPFSDIRREDIVKLDYQLSAKHQFSFRYLYDVGNYINPRGFGATPTFNLDRYNTVHNLQGTWTWVTSPRTLNEVAISSNHLRLLNTGVGETSMPQTYGLTVTELFGNHYSDMYGLPGINISGYTGITGSLYAGSPMWTGSIRDNFSYLRGKHTIKFGGQFFRDRKNQWNYSLNSVTFNPSGNLYSTGSGLMDSFLGNYQQLTGTDRIVATHLRFSTGELYIADSAKLGRKLTLDMGLRFLYAQAPYASDNNNSTFLPTAYDPAKAQSVIATGADAGKLAPGVGQPFNGIVVGGDAYLDANNAPADPQAKNLFRGLPRGLFPDQKKFSPRLGMAYDVFGNGKFAVRAGAGITYSRFLTNYAGSNPPFVKSVTLYSGNWNDSTSATSGSFPVAVTGTRLDRVYPATYNWNFGIQRQMPFGTLLDLNYVSTQGRHLTRTPNVNQVTPAVQYPNRTLNVNSLRPYQGYTNLNLVENSAASNYNGLQAGLTRRFSKGLTYSVAYTFSKVLTDSSDDGTGVENLLNYRAERSHASFDRNQILVLSYVYNLPFFERQKGVVHKALGGWTLSGISQFQSGAWLTPAFSTAVGTRRPDRVGNVRYFDPRQVQTLISGSGVNSTGNYYFDPTPGTTFIAPPNDQYGNSSPNIVRGPGRNNWDIATFKNVGLGEKYSIQFRAEFFNIFNHASFRNPNMTANDRNYATISDAGPPRLVQFALKLLF